MFSAVMLRSPALCLTWYGIPSYTLTIFCNHRAKVRERIHLLQLVILNEYVARYAVAHHDIRLVDVDE